MTDIGNFASSIPSRLGVSATLVDGALILRLAANPPVTRHGMIRASVLTYLVDAAAGLLVDRDPGQWTFTTDLSLRMRAVPAPARVDAFTTVLRQGRRSVTCDVDVADHEGAPVAYGTVGFAHVPRREGDPPKPLVRLEDAPRLFDALDVIDEPLRDAAGIEILDAAAGVARVAVTAKLRNPAGTLQGAMVALLAEAAAEELYSVRLDQPAIVTDLDIRYLAQARTGVIRTRTHLLGDQPDAAARIELIDTADDRVTTHVLVRAAAVPDGLRREPTVPCADPRGSAARTARPATPEEPR